MQKLPTVHTAHDVCPLDEKLPNEHGRALVKVSEPAAIVEPPQVHPVKVIPCGEKIQYDMAGQIWHADPVFL